MSTKEISISISIENVTINVGGEPRTGLSPVFGVLLHRAIDAALGGQTGGAAETTGEELTGTQTETAATQTTGDTAGTEAAVATGAVETTNVIFPTLDGDNIIRFLNSSGKYRLRSLKAVAKHFGVSEDAALEAVTELVSQRKVKQRTKRGDRSRLFEALVQLPVPVAAPAADPVVTTTVATPAPGDDKVTAEKIVEFLNSNDQYRYRTMKAIVKHFDAAGSDAIEQAMEDAIDDGNVATKRRRSDGVTLYYAVQ